MNRFLAARLNALCAILHPEWDPEYELRAIYRWYSRTFHTPLHQVAELPLDEVLQNYYEARFEELEAIEPDEKDPDQRSFLVRERDKLAENDEERAERLRAEAEDEELGDKFLRQVEREEDAKAKKWAADAKKGKSTPRFSTSESLSDAIDRAARDELAHISASARKAARALRGAPDRIDPKKLPRQAPILPPDVMMTFDDKDED